MNYNTKSANYYANIRTNLVQLLDPSCKDLRVLEVGAAYGETLYFLKQKGIAKEAIGVELYRDEANKDHYKPIDQFIFGNIEDIDLSEYQNYFDLIIFADVLEHLFEPKKILKKASLLLNNRGQILVSMPNIRHYSALIKIFIKGDFKYEESGIFDFTHLKFYCKKNIIELIESSNFELQTIESSIKRYKGKSFAKILNRLTFGVFQTFFTTQYFLLANTKK